jgi:hypothetical protein
MPCPVCARTDSNPEPNTESSEVNTLRAQLAALRDERDRAVRCLREIMGWADWGDYAFAMHEYLDAENFAPGDFDWLRQHH